MTTSGTTTSTLTAQEIITLAMQEIGVIASGEQPTAEESADALTRINWLLKSMVARGANLWRDSDGSAVFPPGVATVSLSPAAIDVGDVRAIGTFDRLLYRMEREEYRELPRKTTVGVPSSYSLSVTPAGISMTLWPVPAVQTTVSYSYERVIEDVTALTQTIDVPQAWLECVWLMLAVRLAPTFGAMRADPTTVAAVAQRAGELEAQLMDRDRPASIFMGPEYGRHRRYGR